MPLLSLSSGFISSSGVLFRAVDNPTVFTIDYVWICTSDLRLLVLCLCLCSFPSPSLSHSLTHSLCHDSYVPLYAQTQTDSWLDDFWLRRESASAHASSVVVWAQQVLATSLLLSSVLCVLVLECTVLQTQLKKKKQHKYLVCFGKFLNFILEQCVFVWHDYEHLSSFG